MCEPCGCVIVPQDRVKLTEVFGKFRDVLRPGLHLVWPCLCQSVAGSLSTRIQQCEIRAEAKTKDNVFTSLRVAVQYRIDMEDESVYNANYKLSNPVQQIEAYVYDVVRSSVPKIELDNVFLSKDQISAAIKEQLREAMASFGYVILASPITDIEPEPKVKQAMNEINRAKRMREVAVCEGEANKVRALKEAEAEAARTEIQAKADAEAKYMAGMGISRQRKAIIQGMKNSVNQFRTEVEGIDAKQVMDLMIVTQHFDMMKDVGAHSKTNAIFMNPSAGGGISELTNAVQAGFMSTLPAAGNFAGKPAAMQAMNR
jgi:regulator of protease activity HflC (stomatin/prohibitin superfamily)